jgi:hypothetical protein
VSVSLRASVAGNAAISHPSASPPTLWPAPPAGPPPHPAPAALPARRPTASGQLGAASVAAAVQDVAVAGQQPPRRDELVGVAVAGEPERHAAPVRGVPQPGDGRLGLATRRGQQVVVHDAAAPGFHHVKHPAQLPPLDQPRGKHGEKGRPYRVAPTIGGSTSHPWPATPSNDLVLGHRYVPSSSGPRSGRGPSAVQQVEENLVARPSPLALARPRPDLKPARGVGLP